MQSHTNLLPKDVYANQSRLRGRPSQEDISMDKGGMKRAGSSGILDLFEGDHRRREGSTLIARQIELENMKVRQYRAKEKVNDTNSSIRQEQKMNQYLEKINREHHSVEQW